MTGSDGGISVPRSSGEPSAPLDRFRRDAMATTFEVVIAGQDSQYARQAAETAFEDLDRLEQELSRFIPSSDVSQINRLRAGESLRVGAATMECLRLAGRIHAETAGAFDVTIGALMECRPGAEDSVPPSEGALAAARKRTGMKLLAVDDREHAVAPRVEGLKVDLGGIGKGYAVDAIVAVLGDWSVDSALVHAGASSALAVGAPAEGQGWMVEIRDPAGGAQSLGRVRLSGRAMSGSGTALHGRHIIDPRTGRPAEGKLGAWAAAPSAAESDALATAFMAMTPAEVEGYCRRHPQVSAMLAVPGPERAEVLRWGRWDE